MSIQGISQYGGRHDAAASARAAGDAPSPPVVHHSRRGRHVRAHLPHHRNAHAAPHAAHHQTSGGIPMGLPVPGHRVSPDSVVIGGGPVLARALMQSAGAESARMAHEPPAKEALQFTRVMLHIVETVAGLVERARSWRLGQADSDIELRDGDTEQQPVGLLQLDLAPATDEPAMDAFAALGDAVDLEPNDLAAFPLLGADIGAPPPHERPSNDPGSIRSVPIGGSGPLGTGIIGVVDRLRPRQFRLPTWPLTIAVVAAPAMLLILIWIVEQPARV